MALDISRTRTVPFLILASVVVGIAIVFYHVIKPMLVPLFLAGVTVLLASPQYEKLLKKFPRYPRIVALIATAMVVAIIITPGSILVVIALEDLAGNLGSLRQFASPERLQTIADPASYPALARLLSLLQEYAGIEPAMVGQRVIGFLGTLGEDLYGRTAAFIKGIPWAILNIFIFGIATYFFLLDGQKMIQGWKDITPLRSEHDSLIRNEFANVCRSVVWGTLLAAMVQAFLLVVGLLVIGIFSNVAVGNWIILLGLLTIVFAMIPFVGAVAVWLPTAIWMFLGGHHGAAVALAIYGGAVISTVDNLVKIWVIKDAARIHPLFVFVCVFGGLKLLGLIGIFVGPIVGAVLFAMVKVLRKELTSWMTTDVSEPTKS